VPGAPSGIAPGDDSARRLSNELRGIGSGSPTGVPQLEGPVGLEQQEAAIANTDDKPLAERLAGVQSLRAKPGPARFLRVIGSGTSVRLRVDRAAVAAEQRLDGKFLLRTSDPTLSAREWRSATSSSCSWSGPGET
jgi:hypothetical protein